MTQVSSNIEIDIDCNNIRERSVLSSKNSSRNSSMSSSALSVPYYQHMEINNDLPDVKSQKPINSS